MSSKHDQTDSSESVDTTEEQNETNPADNENSDFTDEFAPNDGDNNSVDTEEGDHHGLNFGDSDSDTSSASSDSETDGVAGGSLGNNPDEHGFDEDDDVNEAETDSTESSDDHEDGEGSDETETKMLRAQIEAHLNARLSDEESIDERLVIYELADNLNVPRDDEEMQAVFDEVAVVEDGDVVGVSTTPMHGSDDYVRSWAEIRDVYRMPTGKSEFYQTKSEKLHDARLFAANRLMEDGNWIYYAPTETGEESFYYYNPDTGKYKKDDYDRLSAIIEKKLGPHHDTTEEREIKRKLEVRAKVGYEHVNARHMDGIWLNTQSCVVRIDKDGCNGPRDWETREHSPEFRFISQSVDNAPFPIDANGDLLVEYDTLKWTIDWLQSLFDDDHSWKVLTEVFGASLRPDQYFKFFAMLVGPTNAGKSRVVGAWEGTLGRDNTTAVKLQQIAEGNFSSGEFFRNGGSMWNSGNDIEKRKLKQNAALKTLTTNDVNTHDVKHEWGFDGISPSTQTHVANREVFMDPDADAIPERMKYLRFPIQFYSELDDEYDEDDPYIQPADSDLEEKLNRDGVRTALFLLALEGLYRLYENDKTFSYPSSHTERWNEYISRADVTGEFAMDCLQNTEATNDDGMDCWLTADEINNLFQQWRHAKSRQSKSKDQLLKELNQVPGLAMHSQRTSKTSPGSDKENVRWRLTLTEMGLEYCEDPDVVDRMVTEFGIFEDENDGGAGSAAASSTSSGTQIAADGGADLFTKVTNAIAQLGNANATGAKPAAILRRLEDDVGSVDDLDAVLMRGIRKGKFVMTDDGGFQVVSNGGDE